MATTTWPGEAQASAAVLMTQPMVTQDSSFFLAAQRSAQAPKPGMVSMTMP